METRSVEQNGGPEAFIGVDVGGTHTDVVGDLRHAVERGKALTTYDDFSRGVLEAVEVAAEQLRPRWPSCSRRTQLFINGTTVVTNAITQLRGSKVGRAHHAGFKDAFRIAGGAAHDRDRRPPAGATSPTSSTAARSARSRSASTGRARSLVPLDLEQVEAEAKRLVERGRRRAIADLLPLEPRQPRARAGGRGSDQGAVPGPLRHAVPPRLPGRGRDPPLDDRGAELVRPGPSRRLPDIAQRRSSRERGPRRAALAFFQGLGGGISLREGAPVPARPARSGPAGGAIGANELGQAHGPQARSCSATWAARASTRGSSSTTRSTSRRTSSSARSRPGVNIVDVVSVGAGGGSIALGQRARRAAGRPAERRLDARPGGATGAAARSRPSPTRW